MGIDPNTFSESLRPYLNDFNQPVGKQLTDFITCQRLPDTALIGQYAYISPLKLEDLRPLFTGLNTEPALWTYMPHGPFANLDAFTSVLSDYNQNKGFQTFVIKARDDAAALGMASFMRYDHGNGTVEIGFITFSSALRRSKIATEAMYLMMRHAFEHGYRRYEWKCDQLNAASVRAALRLGFRFEGIFRNAVVYKGRRRDTAWFSVIQEDWPRVKARLETWLNPSNFDDNGLQRVSLSSMAY